MNKDEYINFRNELIEGQQANLKDFEKESANFFEACLPIEEIARRGVDTMRYGPLKSIGLWNPEWGDLFDKEKSTTKYSSKFAHNQDFGNNPDMSKRICKESLNSKLIIMKNLKHMGLVEDPSHLV